ncbi:UvrD-helicase domain-containing protein [Nocardioides sp.]|uniref:UvrD-helicase domain-containing protein n=1 Tax=Nocardioides sp. TaxID=35761 RepID=UPI00261F3D3F|nr:UvrD-helicase domain-containing protein [Nocardioides sp.]
MSDVMEHFDAAGPLPRGTVLLEASAGTGKTWTVATLVTRYVAEGVATLDQLLVITFGRAATQELRERVREHLTDASRTLTDPEQRRRVIDALASFDAATIATTHQFCQIVLRSLGVAGDSDPGTTLVESVDDLLVEVVDDLYLRWYAGQNAAPPISRDLALRVSRESVADPRAALAEPGPDAAGQARAAFAREVRVELERRKRQLGILSYDDLLSRLADALAEPDSPARARMRQRWRIVLVDEFQDTDPVQWQVLERAFAGHSDLVLIGDPKQAIYGFRGGDVATYLDAARSAQSRATLGRNWRSDADLVAPLQVVWEGAQLGDPAITVLPIEATTPGTRLRGAGAPWRMRQVSRDGFRLRSGNVSAADARSFVARDCAADIARVLAEGATWDGEPLQARHIAVIVARRDHGMAVQRELTLRGVPAVMAGGGDVFQTEAADAWLTLLEALESPHRTGLVRAVALTPFFGYRAHELATDPGSGGREEADRLTSRLADTVRGWAILLRSRGVAALVEAAEERGLTARVLGQVEGDRLLTDLRHLGQLLHDLQSREGLGLTGLLEWFRSERRRTAAAERPRRLDSDAAAVQIVTIWGSKGLQYPITYVPFAYDNWVNDSPDVVRFHDRDPEGRPIRSLDVSGSGTHLAAHLREELGEELRNLYVALTRAQSQVVTWWAPTFNTPSAGLHRMIFGRRPGTAEVPERVEPRDDDYVSSVFTALAQLGGPVHELAVIAPASSEPLPATVPDLAVRAFTRRIDTEWRRTSYSGLIRAAEEAGVGSEPEAVGHKDDDDPAEIRVSPQPDPGSPPSSSGFATRSPMADLPAGAGFGSLVHAVLEHADPTAPDLVAELATQIEEQRRWWPVDAPTDDLATGLEPLNRTPLGPLADDLTLVDLDLTQRLCELDFEIPLTGGDHSRGEARLRDLAPVLRRHLPPGDPVAAYAERLEAPGLGDQTLRGYLSGSIDAVLRIPDPGVPGGSRFVVVDYKTNFLGETVGDYAADRLAEAMLHSHYPLQAMLYGVVLHRFLRWRLAGYDPEVHLGGVLYLYVRGMAGPETPTVDGVPTGVFSWHPPAALTVALSELLDGEGA